MKSFFMGSFVMAVLSVTMFVIVDVARGEQVLAPEQSAVELKKRTAPQITEKREGDPEAAETVQNATAEEGKSGVTTAHPEKPEPELDRRWIIKMNDEKGKNLPVRKPALVAWTGKDQQTRCEAYLPGLQESFSKTRYYSVGGDGCNTAGSAGSFLDLVRACQGDCPQGFLESRGYSQQILRNVEILQQLGKKKCVESTREIGTAKVEADKAVKGKRVEERGSRFEQRTRPDAGPHPKERRKAGSRPQDEGGEKR